MTATFTESWSSSVLTTARAYASTHAAATHHAHPTSRAPPPRAAVAAAPTSAARCPRGARCAHGEDDEEEDDDGRASRRRRRPTRARGAVRTPAAAASAPRFRRRAARGGATTRPPPPPTSLRTCTPAACITRSCAVVGTSFAATERSALRTGRLSARHVTHSSPLPASVLRAAAAATWSTGTWRTRGAAAPQSPAQSRRRPRRRRRRRRSRRPRRGVAPEVDLPGVQHDWRSRRRSSRGCRRSADGRVAARARPQRRRPVRRPLGAADQPRRRPGGGDGVVVRPR